MGRREGENRQQAKGLGMTKPQLFQSLCLFGMIYLRKYPWKTISFLEYMFYMHEQALQLLVQGVIRLEMELCHMFLINPELNWTKSDLMVSARWDTIKQAMLNKNAKEASSASNKVKHDQKFQKAPVKTKFKSKPRFQAKSHDKSEVCRNWNRGSCTRQFCKFRHVCSKCEGSHPQEQCK